MAVKIYSGYDEFKFEEEEVCEYLESTQEDYDDDQDKDTFFYTESSIDSIDDYTFYVISDTEDEDLAEDVSNYLGKPNKFFLVDLHKTVFIIK